MKASEIREKPHQEILEELEACKRELLNLRFQWQAGELRNSAQYRQIRKNVARLKTVLREAELGINTNLFEKKSEKEST
ncbi:MAG: 50S ribosomal protein L29 [Planctomycetes bacterium GWA2_40_7]|nr:MAG: 50S ribosomal protein L29 [Planctomycetes bacterium GWA2_40_7]OHB47873.1 MAG: 50S ribosomal protein L29 [Planctomycetes bacterium GWF2_40_8]OHB90755.1 MAG: 50S ribosomal protein L29 [Planctomycetes bacterium RIFCSPHIGHO2_02_FULL_40_12]OHC02070.1 MAG: 50S ribosomal protein L29 [Planctomycetes bacterium RIFCSPLOWO2_12_FULL_40_19]